MILTVTVNAAVDKTLTVANLQLGHRHRAQQGLVMAGGKGINVARALKRLGEPVIATGLAGGHNGARILDEMTAEGILNDFVRIRGESRTSTVVVDPTSSVQTEIYEYGPEIVRGRAGDCCVEKLRYLSGAITTVVLAGSLPRKVPTSFYADIVRDMGKRKVRTVVDCDGEPLRKALAAESGARLADPARGRGARRARVPDRRGLPARAHRRSPRWARPTSSSRSRPAATRCCGRAAAATASTAPGSPRSSRSRPSDRRTRSSPAS